MEHGGTAFGLVGRQKEVSELEQLVAATRTSLSGAVVLRGEAGVGKTALLQAAVQSAPGHQHLGLRGIEAESGFAFAGLERLVSAGLGDLEHLPAPQREALDVAFGRSSGPAADPFLVGLATLSLLAEAAAGRPTLVTVDDAHWLDRESLLVLGFTARRLDAEGVAMVFAARPGTTDLTPFDGLPVLEITDLDSEGSRDLLRRVVGPALDERVAERIIEATAGNPLALRDLGASLSEPQVGGSVRLPEPLSVGRRLEAHYLAIVGDLPAPTRTWLLVAAAEPSGDLAAITAAAAQLDLTPDAIGPAERAGVVTLRDRVEFRHPLVRTAIYGSAAGVDRRAAHRALAAAISAELEPDRRARHLARAAAGPDEAVAAELERSAVRAQHRGGFAARADLLERAASLTPEPGTAAARTLDAAEAAFAAGAYRRSLDLLEGIDTDLLDARQQARGQVVEAEAVVLSGAEGGSAQIAVRCLRAAELAQADPDLAQGVLAQACLGVVFADRLLQGTTLEEIAEVARSTPPGSDSLTAALVRAFTSLCVDGYEASLGLIREAVARLLDPATPDDEVLHRHVLGITLCTVTCDDEARWAVHERVLRTARETGALKELNMILYSASMALTIWGRLDDGDDLLTEGAQLHAVLAQSSRQFDIYRHAELAAWRGGDRAAIEDVLQATRDAGLSMGHGAVVGVASVGRVVLELSCGGYEAARLAAADLLDHEGFCVHTRVLPDLVEAAARSGHREQATEALELLRSRATASATPFGLGLLARSEAVLAPDGQAEAYHREAIDRLGRTAARADLARAHLLYGEWLRRVRRPSDARDQLRAAHDLFTQMGALGFAERARVELAATGERVRSRTPGTVRDLTSQERQIAMLAADGLTNAEIASRLFISAPTVDYHLRKVFRKLDIGSRRQLRGRTL